MRYDGQNSVLDPQPVQKSGSVGNMATTGESTRNQETGSEYRQSQPQVEQRGEPYNRYPSLKKAVANTSYSRFVVSPLLYVFVERKFILLIRPISKNV